jgi:WD40 repeat protein
VRAAAIVVVGVGCSRGPSPTAEPIEAEVAAEVRAEVVRAPPVQRGAVTGATLRARVVLGSWPGALAWSPDARWVATGDDAGALQVWDARTGAIVREVGRYPRGVSAVAWAADGVRVAAAAAVDLRVWDAREGKELRALPGHGDLVEDLRFVGEELLAVDLRNELRRWDPRGGGPRTTAVPTIHALRLAISPAGDALAIGGYGDVALLDLASGAQRFAARMPSCADRPGDLLCVNWREVMVEEFPLEPGGSPSLHRERSPNWYVTSLAFSADGSRLAIGRADGVAVVFEVASGRPLVRFVAGADAGAAVALTADGATLAFADRDGRVSLWDVASGKGTPVMHEPGAVAGPVAFAPDDAALAVGGPGQAATIWALGR